MGLWSYEGKRVVIAGCFSGMGEAAAQELVRLGAEVHGVDVRESKVPMASFRTVDLKDRASIDAAVAGIGGEIDALFNCAGLPQTFPAEDVMTVNFIGMRYWTESWIPKIRKGGGVATIASNAAYQYQNNLKVLSEFVNGCPDWDSAVAWVRANPDKVKDGYAFSKEAIVFYTLKRAAELAKQGVRLNVTLPSPTKTPMMDEFVKIAPKQVFDAFSEPTGRHSTPAEQAWPLLFLNMEAAAFVSGLALPVDGGFVGGIQTGVLDMQQLLARAMA